MSDAEQEGIEAIRQAARDANKRDAKLLHKIIKEETKRKAEVLRELPNVSNECIEKCGCNLSEV